MIVYKYVITRSDHVELMITESTVGKNLKQMETGNIYESGVIDVIAGYHDGVPYPQYTYVEVDDDGAHPEDVSSTDYKTALQILLGVEDGDLQ